MARVLVINAPFIKDFCRTQRWPSRTRARVLRPPEWLAYVTAVLENKSIDVRLYDFPANDWDKNKLGDIVREKRPDFVVFDSTTPSIYSDIDCCGIVKRVSNARTIMVGPHVSVFPYETLQLAEGSLDVVCIGEYDYTVYDVINNWRDLRKIKGIAYFDNGKFYKTEPREFIEDLDNLPFPAWKHLNLWRYYAGMRLYPFMNIIGGRGCPFRCTFCLWPQVMHGHKYRLRSAKNIVDEIEYDIKLFPPVKRGEIFFEDDTFTANKEHVYSICEEILRRNLKITWSVNARVDLIDMELFRLMKRAGCRALWLGIESGVQEVLANMKKGIKIDQIRHFVELSKKAGLHPHGCFVLGMPGETKETMQKTIDFAMELKLPSLQFSAAVPYPGTEYFKYCEEQNLLRAKQWSDWLEDGEQSSVVDYPGLSRGEINRAVDFALKKHYFRPTYMINFLLRTRSIYDLYRKLKGFKNFVSYLYFKKRVQTERYPSNK